jgi:hypothetical protein
MYGERQVDDVVVEARVREALEQVRSAEARLAAEQARTAQLTTDLSKWSATERELRAELLVSSWSLCACSQLNVLARARAGT